MKVTIRNEFTGQQITIDASKPVTASKVRAWRSKLHPADCTSGDDLGGRGKQADPEAYLDLLERAQQVLATGRDELGEVLRNEITEAVAGLCCPDQVCDEALRLAETGGDWRATIAKARSNDAAERKALGI